MASTIASHIAQAVARAQLFEAEARARAIAERNAERLARLQALTAAFSKALTPAEVGEVVADVGVTLGGARAAVWTCTDHAGTLEAVGEASVGVPPQALIGAVERLEPVWEDDAAYVPLVFEGECIGGMAVDCPSVQSFDGDDRALVETVAQQAAQAIQRARLYESARANTRAREELLGVVSHDLRNPVGAVLLGARSLMRLDVPGEVGARVKKNAASIHRSAERMSRLIDDLLDFGAMQDHSLSIERRSCSAEEIVTESLESLMVLAQQRKLRVETAVDADLPELVCDRDRTLQALGNLISNAVKATPPGGTVIVGAERAPDGVTFFVSDTGPGLAADEIPRVFERWARGQRVAYKGMGLGLTIARAIVVAHGGRIWGESAVGRGSRFCFCLPLAAG